MSSWTRALALGVASLLAAAAAAQEPQPAPSASPPPAAEEALPPIQATPLRAAPTPGAPTISLARAVSVALGQNFGLLSAADDRQAAVYGEKATRADFYPKFTPRWAKSSDESVVGLEASQKLPWSGGSLAASAAFRSGTPGAGATDSTDARVTLTQPILRGFGPTVTNFDLVNSRRAVQAQDRGFELARQQLAIEVTAAFFQVVRQRQLLEVAQQSLKRSEALREGSEARLQVGLASRLDVLRAELQAAQARDAMVSSQAALETALEQLRVLLAIDPAEPLEPEEVVLADSVPAETEPLEALLARALELRLELAETRDRVADAERRYALARQNLLPQLDVSVAFTQLGSGASFSDSLARPIRRTNVFLTTSYPVERSADRAQKAVAALELEASRRALRQRELDVAAEVRAAVRNLERIRKSVELQRIAVQVAEQQHRLATLRYQRGLASNFDVVDAEGSLVSARTALVGLLTDHQVARMQLLRATGTLDVAREFGL